MVLCFADVYVCCWRTLCGHGCCPVGRHGSAGVCLAARGASHSYRGWTVTLDGATALIMSENWSRDGRLERSTTFGDGLDRLVSRAEGSKISASARVFLAGFELILSCLNLELDDLAEPVRALRDRTHYLQEHCLIQPRVES